MAFPLIHLLFYISLLTHGALALQVTPNSPCASFCLDNPELDPSDPNSSNTNSADIVCQNADYNTTSAGTKFMACVNCLQTSTYSSGEEDDQSWFIYNLRYALDSCVFSFSNASDSTSTPCTLPDSCGPLQYSLEDGNLVPGNGSTYSFCSSNSNTILGSYLPKCIGCLGEVSPGNYLANFLIAIQAGCEQQPPVGTNIGLQGTLFSSTRINITYPGYKASSKSSHNGLSQGAIIGISVGIIVLVVTIAAALFICQRKRTHTKAMKQLTSPLDSRFGSNNITSPVQGAYSNPKTSPHNQISHAFDSSALSGKELNALGLEMPNFQKQHPIYQGASELRWEDAHALFEATQDLIPRQLSIPAHQAYIPSAHVPISPADSTGTDHTSKSYQVSSYASSRSSPKNLPLSIKVPESRNAQSRLVDLEKQTTSPLSSTDPYQNQSRTSTGPKGKSGPPLQRDGLPRLSAVSRASAPRMSLNTKVQSHAGLPRDPTPVEGHVTQFPPRSLALNTNLPPITTRSRDPTPIEGPLTQIPPRSKLNTNSAPISAVRSRDPTPIDGQLPSFTARTTVSPLSTEHPAFMDAEELASQAPRPAMHSQQPSLPYDPPSRSHSRAVSWKRGGTSRDTSTERATVGSRKRTGSRGTIRDNSTERTTTGGRKRTGSRTRDASTERSIAGGWKRSGSRGTIRDSSVERPAAAVRISGPMIIHGARFDFEAAEKEMRDREAKLKTAPDATPSSAESCVEQWPGNY